MSSTTPEVGDRLVFEGLPSTIVALADGKVEFVSDLKHTRTDGVEVPKFRSVANAADLLYSTRLAAWYLWGRVLSKGRGGVGEDQRAIAARMRDMGVIPSRDTRQQGAVPAPGESHGLFCDLFADGSVNWTQECRNVRMGEGLSTNAAAKQAAHLSGFKSKRLNHGYADRNDGDPGFESVTKKGA